MIMTITFIQQYQLILLQPQGCLDLQKGKTLREQIAGLEPQPHHILVIDLAQVDFMDSSGLATLVKELLTARSNGYRLIVCDLQASVRMIFELTQMDSAFEILENYNAVLTTVNAHSVKYLT